MSSGSWYRFDFHGRIPVTLFTLDGGSARAGAAGTKRFREAIASAMTDDELQALVRSAINVMPDVRRRWQPPLVPKPAGLKAGEREVTVEALLLASGNPPEDVLRLAAAYRSGGTRVPTAELTEPRIEIVASERLVTRTFPVKMVIEREAHRREGELVQEFIAHLDDQRVECVRLALPLEGTKLYNDLHVPSRNQLIEAKGDVRRESIRMAIGQLADYVFQIERDQRFEQLPTCGILLPQRPLQSMERLLDHLEIACVWRNADTFEDNRGGAFT